MKEIVKSTDVLAAPFNTYDSILELPDGRTPGQNAWLTLQLRIRLNFVDSTNRTDRVVVQNGQLFIRDLDGYLFPAIDWPTHLKTRFQTEYAKRAEDTWNFRFQLLTPNGFGDFDYKSSGMRFRPNVLCLFRMSLLSDAGRPIDSTPAAGALRTGPAHRTIDVFNLSLATKSVTNAGGQNKNVEGMDGLAFRSDARHYDDRDLFNPAWWQPQHAVLSNTVGHEVGHALGQCHIMGLKGIDHFKSGGANANDTEAYGVGSPNPKDSWNIMGGGDRVERINSVSWRERLALHTGVPAPAWTINMLGGNLGAGLPAATF